MSQPLKLLIVEDNPLDAELVLRQLRRADYETTWERVDTEADYLDRLGQNPDLIISDYEMPQFSGLQAVKLLKARGVDIPLIIVSGTIGEDTAVEAMKEGAVDYLLKDRLGRLGQAVAHALEERQLRRARVTADQELRTAHAQVRELLARSPVVVYGLRLEGTRIIPRIVSENILTILGFTPGEALSYEWWVGRLHPGDRAHAIEVVANGLAQNGYTTEYRLQHKDGTYRWVEDRNRVLPGAATTGREAVGIWVDITERKRAEEILQLAAGGMAHHRRKTATIELALIGVGGAILYGLASHFEWFKDVDDWLLARGFSEWDTLMVTSLCIAGGLVVFAFRRLRESTAELSGRHQLQGALRLLHDELDWRVKQRTTELAEANDLLRAEIAERQRAEQAARASEERFRQIAENIHEVFWMTDPAKNVMLYISPAYETIWGRTCESLYQKPLNWVEALHPDDRARVIEAATAKQAKGTYDETYRIVRPDGSLRWIHDRAFPIRDQTRQVYRVVGTAEDITERKSLEEQFFHAQRLEAIGTLASGVAHDLNNILAPILMAAPLLRVGLPPEKAERMLDTVEKSAQRGAELVKRLLTFGRGAEGQRGVLQPKVLVLEMAKIAQQTFSKSITISTKIVPDAWPLIGDATQLHQVLLNLCVNARDAMPQGGTIAIEVENVRFDKISAAMKPGASPGPYVLIRVRDTGTGIPPEVMDKIFAPFFTTKEIGKGTGLGLSTVMGIAKNHDGFVTVTSEVGRGTAFEVYFPAVPGSAAPEISSAGAALPAGNGELILVVDDEDVIRDILRDILVQNGYRVIAAADGAMAAAKYVQHRDEIRAVVTDLDMPVMDGLALVRALKKIDPGLPVLISSGLASSQGIANRKVEMQTLGITESIQKPYTVEKIVQALHDLLAGKGKGS